MGDLGASMYGGCDEDFEGRQRALREAMDEEERQRVESLQHTYYLNFPQRNPEKDSPRVMLPCGEYSVHQNSIYDLIWLRGSQSILTASGDMESVVFDLTRQQISLKLGKMHDASIKTVAQLESNWNIVLTGGREGRIVVHDMRQ